MADPDDFILAMDGISQTTYDAAEAIAALGPEHWLMRDLLVFLDTAEVAPAFRGHGIGRTLAEAIVDATKKSGLALDVLLQPYPLAIKSVERAEAGSRRIATRLERKQEMERITQLWLRVFPFVSFLSEGGLEGDRRYYLGRSD